MQMAAEILIPKMMGLLGKIDFSKNSGRYHQMDLAHHKGKAKLAPDQI